MNNYSDEAAWETATQQIHGGYAGGAFQNTVAVPIYQTAAYEFADFAAAGDLFAQRRRGNTYSRTGNPTVAVFEQRIAALDGGAAAVGTASGQSAVAVALLALAAGGRHIVASSEIYGGTVDLLADTFPEFGISTTFVDPLDPAAWEAALRPETCAVFLESIGNPLATLADLPVIAGIAHRHGVPVVVDNTLATPALYRPLEHGADIVVYSATKFLGGHGTSLAGAVVDGGRFPFAAFPGRWPQLARPSARLEGRTYIGEYGEATAYAALVRSKYLHDLGPSLSPFNAFQILQGLETLDLRMARHSASALEVAELLDSHPAVARVHYPALPGHPRHGLAVRDFPAGAGSVFGFDLKDAGGAGGFIDALRLFKLVANVGDTRSLVSHPATMTHARLTPEQRTAAGISAGTIRLSVGLEDPRDLIADLKRALE